MCIERFIELQKKWPLSLLFVAVLLCAMCPPLEANENVRLLMVIVIYSIWKLRVAAHFKVVRWYCTSIMFRDSARGRDILTSLTSSKMLKDLYCKTTVSTQYLPGQYPIFQTPCLQFVAKNQAEITPMTSIWHHLCHFLRHNKAPPEQRHYSTVFTGSFAFLMTNNNQFNV